MAPSGESEIEYLKRLVGQLNDKIHDLEGKAASAVKTATKAATPQEQLRMILVGPPGAGAFMLPLEYARELSTLIRIIPRFRYSTLR